MQNVGMKYAYNILQSYNDDDIRWFVFFPIFDTHYMC